MVMLKEGDRVDICFLDGVVTNPYSEHDTVRTLEIISTDNYGYYLFVPHYLNLSGSTKADVYRCHQLGISARFIDEQMIYITESMIRGIAKQDGMSCGHCGDFSVMAGPNQVDGKTFICYACRQNPYR
jgi:hypothetical protein